MPLKCSRAEDPLHSTGASSDDRTYIPTRHVACPPHHTSRDATWQVHSTVGSSDESAHMRVATAAVDDGPHLDISAFLGTHDLTAAESTIVHGRTARERAAELIQLQVELYNEAREHTRRMAPLPTGACIGGSQADAAASTATSTSAATRAGGPAAAGVTADDGTLGRLPADVTPPADSIRLIVQGAPSPRISPLRDLPVSPPPRPCHPFSDESPIAL